MKERILACDNDICKVKDECERYRLFKEGQQDYKTHNGKPHKGCGQFIAIINRKSVEEVNRWLVGDDIMRFSDEDLFGAIKHYLPTISEYVKSHGGDIKLLGVKDEIVYIELTGVCKSCAMSIMTTKMVVQKKVQELISPKIIVINVDGTSENSLPDDVYFIEDEIKNDNTTDNKGILNKIKNYIGIKDAN